MSLLLLAAAGGGGAAQAGSFDLGWDTSVNYKVVVSYGVAMRTKKQADALINGPIDPLVIPATVQSILNGTAFTHTGLSTTANFDDGDRNFNKGSLINDRISGIGELEFTHDNYGAVFSGDGFYDQVYHHPNDNDSPGTINHTGPVNHFTSGARYYDGQRTRLLEAYGYGDWNLWNDEASLDLRVGKQLVAWGEALFFTGIALAQSPTDATKAFIPGVEVKDILLPVNQISFQLGLPQGLSLMGYYHLDYKADEIFPVGDFYSIQDAVGPGSQFAYGSINPANVQGCQGLFSSAVSNILAQAGVNVSSASFTALDNLCNLPPGVGTAIGAGPDILSVRGPDIKPSRWGQYGLGLKYPITGKTALGLFYLRYDDTTPAVQLNPGCAGFSTLIPLTTCSLNESVPTSYQVKYYDGIHLLGGTFSTSMGPFNISGELNYRQGLDMPVKAVIDGETEPVYTRGKLLQADLSAIFTTNPGFLVDEIPIVGEVGYIRVLDLEPFGTQPVVVSGNPLSPLPNPIMPTGSGQDPFFSKNSWGYEFLAQPKNHNVISGVDLAYPISFSAIAKGNPEMAGAFGALFGEGDQRLGVGLDATYLDNLEVNVGYNFFFGDPAKTIRGSDLHEHPYADRDNATFSVKYNF
jgi:hypothetical protein